MPEPKGMIRESDYAAEQTRTNAADITAIKQTLQTIAVVLRDLTYIVKELCEHDEEIADQTYGSALEGHLAALDQTLGEGESGP